MEQERGAGLGAEPPLLAGSHERRHFAGILVVDSVSVAADAVGRGIGRGDRGERLRQRLEIAGILQPAVPDAAPRAAQTSDRGVVGLGHAVDIGGNLDPDRPAVTRLVAGNLDPKGLIRHRPSLCPLGSGEVAYHGARTFTLLSALAIIAKRWSKLTNAS